MSCNRVCTGFCLLLMDLVAIGGIAAALGAMIYFGVSYDLFKLSTKLTIGVIVAALVTVVVFILGCMATSFSNKCLQITYAVFMLLLGVVSLGFAIFLMIDRKGILHEIERLWDLDAGDEKGAIRWGLEQAFECCSWNVNPLTYDVKCFTELHYGDFCEDKITSFINQVFWIVVAVFGGLALFLFLGSTCALCAACNDRHKGYELDTQSSTLNYGLSPSQQPPAEATNVNYNYTW